MILSEEQLSTGIDRDYLGMYDFQESYISDKGYKVNISKVQMVTIQLYQKNVLFSLQMEFVIHYKVA